MDNNGSTIPDEGKAAWLRQSLLTVIANYNNAMKARNFFNSSTNAYGPEKRRASIKIALTSLLPENFQSPDGKQIEEANYVGTTKTGFDLAGSQSKNIADAVASKTSGLATNFGNTWNKYASAVPGFNTRKPPSGGKTKKGRKNKNKKSRKSKY